MPFMWATNKKDQDRGSYRLPVCRFCTGVGHTKFTCPRRPRPSLKANKPMNKIGAVQKKTNAAVAKWKRAQQPNHQGYFECYICGAWVTYLEAEHVKSKTRHPELRTDSSNFKPVCDRCNEKKGSKNG